MANSFMQDIARYSKYRTALRLEEGKRTAMDVLTICQQLDRVA